MSKVSINSSEESLLASSLSGNLSSGREKDETRKTQGEPEVSKFSSLEKYTSESKSNKMGEMELNQRNEDENEVVKEDSECQESKSDMKSTETSQRKSLHYSQASGSLLGFGGGKFF